MSNIPLSPTATNFFAAIRSRLAIIIPPKKRKAYRLVD